MNHENVRSSRPKLFNKKGVKAFNFIKKGVWHRCFPVNFAKFVRTPFLIEHLRWLLLTLESRIIEGVRIIWWGEEGEGVDIVIINNRGRGIGRG